MQIKQREYSGMMQVSSEEIRKAVLEKQLSELSNKWGAHFKPSYVKAAEKAVEEHARNFKNYLNDQCISK